MIYKGKEALYLDNGKATLIGSDFKNGIIDFDILYERGRKFLGAIFRIQDSNNFEGFYIRAHQAGNPDALQYTPIFNGISGWQLYHGDGYTSAYNPLVNEWNHVRLIVYDNEMEVFINGMSQPVLKVYALKRKIQSGEIGLWTFLGGAYYANLSYQQIDQPEFIDVTARFPQDERTFIKEWSVFESFDDSLITEVSHLDAFKLANMKWHKLSADYSGIINLSQISEVAENNNTVFAKVKIISNENQIKKIDFGYSDIASWYLNNSIIYSGDNRFQSRDYRYLGTIGFFDSAYLSLKKGINEVVFAITEEMGGWGLKAKIDNLNGIEIDI